MPHQSPVAFPIWVDEAWEVWIGRAPTILLGARRHPPPAWSRVASPTSGYTVLRTLSRHIIKYGAATGASPIVDTKSQDAARVRKLLHQRPRGPETSTCQASRAPRPRGINTEAWPALLGAYDRGQTEKDPIARVLQLRLSSSQRFSEHEHFLECG